MHTARRWPLSDAGPVCPVRHPVAPSLSPLPDGSRLPLARFLAFALVLAAILIAACPARAQLITNAPPNAEELPDVDEATFRAARDALSSVPSELLHLALKARQLLAGDSPLTFARILDELGVEQVNAGHPELALPKFQSALEFRREVHPGDHDAVATTLSNIAYCLDAAGRPAEAVEFLDQAVAMFRRLSPPSGRTDLASALSNQGAALQHLGRPHDALAAYQECLDLRRRLLAPDDPNTGVALNNLATCLTALGRESDAVPLHRQAIEILRRAHPGDDREVASSLANLGISLQNLGRSSEALPLFLSSLEMRTRLHPDGHPELATSFNNLAICLDDLHRTNEVLPYLQAALDLRRRFQPGDHPSIAMSLHNLGSGYAALGRFEDALPILEQGLAMRRRLFPEDHPDTAGSLDGVAGCLRQLGDLPGALAAHQEALQILRRVYSNDHLHVAWALVHVAKDLLAIGRPTEAGPLLLESARILRLRLTRSFPVLSPQQKRRFLDHLGDPPDRLYWPLVFLQRALPARQAWDLFLLTHQPLIEAYRQEHAAFLASLDRAPDGWLDLWKTHQSLTREHATLALEVLNASSGLDPAQAPSPVPTSRSERLLQLASEIDRLDARLRESNPDYARDARLRDLQLPDVAAALHPRDALVAWIRFDACDCRIPEERQPQYGALVLFGDSRDPLAIPLGPAPPIDAALLRVQSEIRTAIAAFQRALPSPSKTRQSEARIAAASAELRALVWDPVSQAIPEAQRVYLVPDGPLSLVSFEALALAPTAPSAPPRYLGEFLELVYLHSPRDLARLALDSDLPTPDPGQTPPTAVLIGNPDFDLPPDTIAKALSAPRAERSAPQPTDRPSRRALPNAPSLTLGTQPSEAARRRVPRNWRSDPRLDRFLESAAAQLKRMRWSVESWTHERALEEHALAVQAPRVLQFATHGYLLDAPRDPGLDWDHPLLRSMLLLAGANRWQPDHRAYLVLNGRLVSEAEAPPDLRNTSDPSTPRLEIADGILTAYEVAGMNLRGTQLVNLTACETGRGEITPEGIAGLRQAFLIAGARSLTVSLWEVPTEETTRQMAAFYAYWLDPAAARPSRYAAFRASQSLALAHARRTYGAGHPFFWAGTLFLGDPGDLPPIRGVRP